MWYVWWFLNNSEVECDILFALEFHYWEGNQKEEFKKILVKVSIRSSRLLHSFLTSQSDTEIVREIDAIKPPYPITITS